jgi:FkbM family methyltransferase
VGRGVFINSRVVHDGPLFKLRVPKSPNSMSDKNFYKALFEEMHSNLHNCHKDNWDSPSRGTEPHLIGFMIIHKILFPFQKVKNKFKEKWNAWMRPLLVDLMRLLWPSLEYRLKIARFKDIGYLYDRLHDSKSKDLLVKLMAFRAMGHRKVKLPQNNPEHWNNIRKIENLDIVGPPVPVDFMSLTLQLRDLSPLGYNFSAYCTGGGGSYIFLQKQYELHRKDVVCKAEPGDIVIDAGACWGETSLYFAFEVGETGRVISYEFIPSNIAVLEKNISTNPLLAERITVVPNPIWSTSGQILYYVDWGPGSRVSFEKLRADFDDTQCETITIDDTVTRLSLPRVDFIKMDIEGAELHALKGAENTLRQFHPKVAISLYHSLEDFKTIPRYLDSLGLSYEFYLDHHTIYENETVLFGIPVNRSSVV